MMDTLPFAEVVAVDFEFNGGPGERPRPVCMVAHELKSGRKQRVWADELATMQHPPFDIGANSLLVAYFASAELGCFLSLGWPMPVNILDLYVEFRNLTNGKPVPAGSGLLGAQTYFGLDGIDSLEKDSMRDLILSNGPWSDSERVAILDYCESDVVALGSLISTYSRCRS